MTMQLPYTRIQTERVKTGQMMKYKIVSKMPCHVIYWTGTLCDYHTRVNMDPCSTPYTEKLQKDILLLIFITHYMLNTSIKV